MRRSARASALALALAAAACGGAAPAVPVLPQQAPAAPAAGDTARSMASEADAVRAVVAAFVAAEARGDQSADTLLATGADFIMGGIALTNRPRLAAMVGRGDGVVEEVRVGVAAAFAYAAVVYRFDSPTPSLRDRARGTFVLERRIAGWRIRHVHTSMVERW